MATLKDIQLAITAALKAGDRTRADALRLLSNEVQKIAKEDKNRQPTDADVITGATRMVKRANETLSFLPVGDDRRAGPLAEIKIVSEFLPKQMSNDELEALIAEMLPRAPAGKAAMGFVMKELNTAHRGQFDNKAANAIVARLITA